MEKEATRKTGTKHRFFQPEKIQFKINFRLPAQPTHPSSTILCPNHNDEFFHHEQDYRIVSINRYEFSGHSLAERACYVDSNGTKWLVIQKRGHDFQNLNSAENFNRSWSDYKHGFGDLSGEFWYGNELLHRLTQNDNVELRISLEDWNGTKLNLDYGLFRVEAEEYNYNLMIGEPKFDRQPLDSMNYHNNQNFSTFDRQNDSTSSDGPSGCCSCAVSYGGGWWYNK